VISLENIENVIEQEAARCMCVTCKKLTCGTCSAGISKITDEKCRGPRTPMFEALKFGKQKKGLQFCFQIPVNVLHVDGISVICITVPRLSRLAAICITIM